LEAALQSAHIERCRTGGNNWPAVVELYDALFALTASPVVAINRALALAEIRGARAGLDELDKIAADLRLAEYQPFWAARAELLVRAGEKEQARAAYEIAVGLEPDPSVRRFLQRRQAEM